MEPLNGTPKQPNKPVAPKKPYDADNADPGEMNKLKQEQFEAGAGKYGETPAQPYKKGGDPEAASGGKDGPGKKKDWIEVELVDEADQPVAGEAYRVTLPDGSIASGTLDEKGFVHIGEIDTGTCKINFPNLDRDAWVRIG
jgi:type VI secretion system secreted protein VgrG